MHINNMENLIAPERDKISHIMRGFDFGEVLRVMEATDWKWGLEVPCLYDLMKTAESLMIDCINKQTEIDTGGFYASYSQQGEEGYILTLRFIIEEKIVW